ncbi:MAG: GvpL/GvpF family gas vesicle protein [Candidatus Acetothermia bacterium]
MDIYLYGVIPAEEAENRNFDLQTETGGIETEIESVTYRGIGFLYSEVDLGVKLRATRKNVQAHSETLADLLERTKTLAPVSFGAILEDQEALQSLARSHKKELKKTLDDIANKVEYGVKAYWDPEEVARTIGKDDREVISLKKKIQRGKVEDRYQATVEVGELIDEKLEEKKEKLKISILDHLFPVSEEWIANDLFDERMAANLAFLLERSAQEAFDEAMKALGKSQPEFLTFKYNGPWPPFNFVNLELR